MKNIVLTIVIPPELQGKRLDAVAAQLLPDYSRTQIQTWILAGNVFINDCVIKKTRHLVTAEETIVIRAELPEKTSSTAQFIALDIIYEDDALIIINKPVGLIVHPGAGNPDQTLVNALLHHDSTLSTLPRAGIIHRLDKDTSGLLIVAKTLEAHHALITQMEARDIEREYRALVQGVMISGGTIDAPIGRHPTARTKMAVIEKGKEAITHYRVIERFKAHTLLSVTLETGRTHQIRVHLEKLRYPIVGDRTYNRQPKIANKNAQLQEALHAFKHQALHAYRLSLTHPQTQKRMTWTADMPEDMKNLLMLMREDASTP